MGLSPGVLVHELFAKGSPHVNHVRPFELESIAQLVKVPYNDLLFQHTFYPYVTAYMSANEREFLASTINSDDTATALAQFKFLGGKPRQHRLLRFCDDCVVEDRCRFGETYWHRQHLLPGAAICTAHRCLLRTTEVPVTRLTPHLPSEMPAKFVDPIVRREMANEISFASQRLLGGETVGVPTQIDRYSQLIDWFGGEPQYPKTVDHPVLVGLRAFYGSSYLASVNFDWARGRTILSNRIRQTPTIPPTFRFTTVKHLLLNILYEHMSTSGEFWAAIEPADASSPESQSDILYRKRSVSRARS
jgi:hypothetical protein